MFEEWYRICLSGNLYLLELQLKTVHFFVLTQSFICYFILNYGGKGWTDLFKLCSKNEFMQSSGNIIQYLSANFVGMIHDK